MLCLKCLQDKRYLFWYPQDLFKSASIKLSGPIDSRHTFADMTSQIVTLKNGTKVIYRYFFITCLFKHTMLLESMNNSLFNEKNIEAMSSKRKILIFLVHL